MDTEDKKFGPKKAYVSNPPLQELLKFSPRDLRHAANWIDRDNNRYPMMSLHAMLRKLIALKAGIRIKPNESELGTIEFDVNGVKITRSFKSMHELSNSLAIGPLDLSPNATLLLKRKDGVFEAEIVRKNGSDNTITIFVAELNQEIVVPLKVAELHLCNTEEGLTAGQMVIVNNE